MKIPVMFQGGSYGSYVSWAMETLFTDIEITNPLRNIGSSHNQQTPTLTIDSWDVCPRKPYKSLTMRIHPKTNASQSMIDNINTLTSYYGQSIMLYPSINTYLLHCNNYCYKIWKNVWDCGLLRDKLDLIHKEWAVPKETSLNEVPRWIIRNWVSKYFFTAMDKHLDWYLPNRLNNPNCLIIFIDDVLYNFTETMYQIQKFCDLALLKNVEDLLQVHQLNFLLQRNKTQDKLAQSIININQPTAWDGTKLTLVTEAWIEKYFRDQGYKFNCENLNSFPISTEELLRCLEK